MSKKIIYITPVFISLSSAASKRIISNSLLLKKIGYEVSICSGENSITQKFDLETIEIIPTGDKLSFKKGLHKLIAYNKSIINVISYLNSLNPKDIKTIIIYSGYSPYIIQLRKWSKLKNIPLIFDAVEWYTPPNILHWFINPYYWNTEFALRYLIPKIKNVVSISNFLHNYYTKKGCNSIIIPPLFNDIQKYKVNTDNIPNNTVISYTGSPGRKDELNLIIETLLIYNKNNNKIINFEIAGINSQQLLQYKIFKDLKISILPNFIKCHGWISMNKAQQITANAKFSILLRKQNKTTIAGFPTKVVESLSFGTPLIINYSSDLKKYIIDEENAYICKSLTKNNLLEIFEKINSISETQYNSMKNNSLLTAKNNFHIDNYINEIIAFLKNLK